MFGRMERWMDGRKSSGKLESQTLAIRTEDWTNETVSALQY